MFRIKLLILLLTSSFILSCTNNKNSNYEKKFSLSYIGGEYDGLLLKNYLLSGLKNLKIYDQNSNIEIIANISHSTNLYITNIDNTFNNSHSLVLLFSLNRLAECWNVFKYFTHYCGNFFYDFSIYH